MNETQNALLLVGSFKGLKSSSHMMGSYLLDRLSAQGMKTEKAFIHPSMKSQEKQQELIEKISRAQVLILACPLYVDSFPAPVIQFMELVARESDKLKNRSFMAIMNCGFPESSQNDTAIEILRHFALQVGFKWLGGLPIGAGGAVNGKPLEKGPGFVKKIMKALDLTVPSLLKGEPIPEESVKILRKPLMPTWMYMLGGNLGWYFMARKNKVKDKLYARPYA